MNFFRLEKFTFFISKQQADFLRGLLVGLTCTNEPVLWLLARQLHQAASLLLDCSCRPRALCAAAPGNGPCPTPASSCAGEFFGGGLISSRSKPCQWFLQHLNNTDCHIPVSRHISWPWLKYQFVCTCNGLQGKAEEGGERSPSQPPVLGIPGVNSSLYLSLGFAGHHSVSPDHSRHDGQQIL